MKPRHVFKNATLAVVSAMFLVGCQGTSDIESPPVSLAYKNGFDQSRVKQGAVFAFRTFVPSESTDSKELKEIKGAKCKINSQEFQASFVTPALVQMPVINGKPSVMHMNCVAGGKKGSRNFAPSRPQTVFVGDPLSMVLANLASAAVTAAVDRWSYAPVSGPFSVVLK